MAENGIFRSKMGGFNKADVLEYINSLQEEQAREMAELRRQAEEQRAAYEQALNDANAALRQQFDELQELRAQVGALDEENRQLRERPEHGVSEQETMQLRQQVATLRQQALIGEQKSEELRRQLREHAAVEQTAVQQRAEQARLAEENRRYQQLVGDVGNFVVEVRGMGQRYLDDANSRCGTRLGAVSAAIAALQEDLTAAMEALSTAEQRQNEQNSADCQRLDELAAEMERSLAQMADKPSSTATPAHFF